MPIPPRHAYLLTSPPLPVPLLVAGDSVKEQKSVPLLVAGDSVQQQAGQARA